MTATTGGSTQPFGFTGEPRDASGLTYLRARYYDPVIGRFMSRDAWPGQASRPSTLGRYPFALGNPSTKSDPSGRKATVLDGCYACALGGPLEYLPAGLQANEAEIRLCQDNPVGCAMWAYAASAAFAMTEHIEDIWHQNGVRHVVWQILLTQLGGAGYAETWGGAHELGTGFVEDAVVDLHNNEVARDIGSKLPPFSANPITAYLLAEQAWSQGLLWQWDRAEEIYRWSDGRPLR